VPQTLLPDGSDDPRRADERFLYLLLTDEELLRKEFDAIIAADWSSPPSASPGRNANAERRPYPLPRRHEGDCSNRVVGRATPGTGSGRGNPISAADSTSENRKRR